MLESTVLQKLTTFDTPTICNIIELFEIRPRNSGYMNGRIIAAFPEMSPIVGYAATATFRADAPPRGQDIYSSLSDQAERFAELDGPAIVVFQDVDDPPVAATFGEVMCTTYQRFGAVGLITSGAGRDLDQVRAINFPVFTGGTICAHGYTHIPQIHVPVRVGDITIYPNDLLHADVNGVTTIPHDIAAETAAIGDEFVAAETIILEALHDPAASLATFKEAQAVARTKISQLRLQVSRQAN